MWWWWPNCWTYFVKAQSAGTWASSITRVSFSSQHSRRRWHWRSRKGPLLWLWCWEVCRCTCWRWELLPGCCCFCPHTPGCCCCSPPRCCCCCSRTPHRPSSPPWLVVVVLTCLPCWGERCEQCWWLGPTVPGHQTAGPSTDSQQIIHTLQVSRSHCLSLSCPQPTLPGHTNTSHHLPLCLDTINTNTSSHSASQQLRRFLQVWIAVINSKSNYYDH